MKYTEMQREAIETSHYEALDDFVDAVVDSVRRIHGLTGVNDFSRYEEFQALRAAFQRALYKHERTVEHEATMASLKSTSEMHGALVSALLTPVTGDGHTDNDIGRNNAAQEK